MPNTLVFFHGSAPTQRSYADFIELAEKIVQQSRLLLSAVEDTDTKLKLNEIIKTNLQIIRAVQTRRNLEEVQQLCYHLTETSLTLPADISAKNRLGSISSLLASLCLFVVALSVAWFAGYLFYAGFYATSLEAITETFIWTCAFDVIPFSLVGLFANQVARSVNDKTTSVEELCTTISEFCQSAIVGEMVVQPESEQVRPTMP